MDNARIAERIAGQINANCDNYNDGIIGRARWDAEQQRLWSMAANAGVASLVLSLVCPSLGGIKHGTVTVCEARR